MNKPLHYYLTGPAADRLADEYGELLEHMTKDQKLLLINVLSGVLYRLEVDPLEDYSIAEYLGNLGTQQEDIRSAMGNAFEELLVRLDDCESSWIEMLVMVLAISVTEQSRAVAQ